MSSSVIPAVPAKVEPQTRIFLTFVRKVLVGMLGNGSTKAVTWKDLIDLGLVDEKAVKEHLQK